MASLTQANTQVSQSVFQSVIFNVDDVHVTYHKNYFGEDSISHFSLQGDSISSTGFKSHFVHPDLVKLNGGEFQYSELLITQLKDTDPKQQELF